jgi:hypothetical protein
LIRATVPAGEEATSGLSSGSFSFLAALYFCRLGSRDIAALPLFFWRHFYYMLS